MFNWKAFEKTKVVLSQDNSYQDLVGQHHITIRPVNLVRWIELACDDLGFFTLVDIAGVDLREVEGSQYQYELTYHLLNMGTHQRLNIHVRFDESELIPSIVKTFSHADWLEREQQEALGIRFNRNMKALLLPQMQKNFPLRKTKLSTNWPVDIQEALPEIHRNPNKSEAPYPEESNVWKNFDTFSAMTSGTFEMMVAFDPIKVVDSKLNIGFYHQGLEKLLEDKDWQQVLQLVDKINLGVAPTYSTAWAKTLEDALRIKIPERAQAIRIVGLELARIAEHFTVMFEMTHALGLDEQKLFINLREKVYELMEKYCGRRQGMGIARIGGVKEDLPHGWIVEYQSVCDIVLKALKTVHSSLVNQKKFREILSGSIISAQTALEWGVSGPAMRAAGLNFDLRKSQPFYFYQDIDFDIPVGINGTAYERYLIRYEEIFQSFRIITQVIDNLPLGEILNVDYDKDYQGVNEQLMSLDAPQGWQYTSLESPNGEAGFLLMFNKTLKPYRLKIKTPSLSLAQALPKFVSGISEEQLKVCLASFGIRNFELDR
jgi:NADH-quinone oxidoreductase subunit C/D